MHKTAVEAAVNRLIVDAPMPPTPRSFVQNPIHDDVLAFVAAKFRLLSDPTRLAILRRLMVHGESNVGEIVDHVGSSQANVSKHLKQLTVAGMVRRRKQGLHVLYQLDDPVIEKICHLVCETILQELEDQMHPKPRPPRLKAGRPRTP
jgi:DNA-binding transcriptional ArsR family regulator